jgi:hypothetical protein
MALTSPKTKNARAAGREGLKLQKKASAAAAKMSSETKREE